MNVVYNNADAKAHNGDYLYNKKTKALYQILNINGEYFAIFQNKLSPIITSPGSENDRGFISIAELLEYYNEHEVITRDRVTFYIDGGM